MGNRSSCVPEACKPRVTTPFILRWRCSSPRHFVLYPTDVGAVALNPANRRSTIPLPQNYPGSKMQQQPEPLMNQPSVVLHTNINQYQIATLHLCCSQNAYATQYHVPSSACVYRVPASAPTANQRNDLIQPRSLPVTLSSPILHRRDTKRIPWKFIWNPIPPFQNLHNGNDLPRFRTASMEWHSSNILPSPRVLFEQVNLLGETFRRIVMLPEQTMVISSYFAATCKLCAFPQLAIFLMQHFLGSTLVSAQKFLITGIKAMKIKGFWALDCTLSMIWITA
jgi:hypothetical protein